MDIEQYAKRTQFYIEDVPLLLSNFLNRTVWNSCLDLGCGDGSLLSSLNKQGYFAAKSVYALDRSQSRLGLVKRHNENFQCLVGDACNIPMTDSSIDFLITTQVVEHVANDAAMVREMQRIVSPNGTVYLATVFKKWYGWYFYRCDGKWTLDPTHLREYSQDDQLLDILEHYGFKILENKKTLDRRPLLDSVLRRVGAGINVYDSRPLRLLRAVAIPIPGYYIWEIVCTKK